MNRTDYQGIDYGLGRVNIGDKNIRYGVINQNEVGQAWYDESEAYYGETIDCQECEATNYIDNSHCQECEEELNFDFLEPLTFYYSDKEYKAECGEDGDIFITDSPYYTYAQFCSPCAPGAVYLMNPLNDRIKNNKGYCFGHDWFESGKAPYPVYSVKTGKRVNP